MTLTGFFFINHSALAEVHLSVPNDFLPNVPCNCPVCDEPIADPAQLAWLTCEHAFCQDCWSQYLNLKISEEGQRAGLVVCMSPRCPTPVDEGHVARLVSPEKYNKYMRFMLEDFVNQNKLLTWCPFPGCEKAIKIPSADLRGSVQCPDHKPWWCFWCKAASHQPATCGMQKAWEKKCSDDSETANWLNSHTKDCPTCHKATEKNGGCNHISCTCGAHWCWMCSGLFDSKTVYSHKCNAFNDAGAFSSENRQSARASLDRYLHYFTRYQAHDQSNQLEQSLVEKIREKMDLLPHIDPKTSWIDVRYLEESVVTLSQCRENLKWTYVLAFYLFDISPDQRPAGIDFPAFAGPADLEKGKAQFEFHQLGLETTTEQLSGMLELSAEETAKKANFRVDVINLTATARRKFDAMFDVIEWLRNRQPSSQPEKPVERPPARPARWVAAAPAKQRPKRTKRGTAPAPVTGPTAAVAALPANEPQSEPAPTELEWDDLELQQAIAASLVK